MCNSSVPSRATNHPAIKTLRCATLLATALLANHSASAGIITKTATGTDLTAGASWSGGVVPANSDVAAWSGSSLGAGLTLGSSLSWQGISVSGAASDIAITGAGTLTLGPAGIDMSASANNLAFSSSLTIGPWNQAWNVTSGKTLTLNTGTFTRNTGGALVVGGGAGTVAASMTGMTLATNLLGPWAVVLSSGTAAANTAAGYNYATISGGNLVAYTGAESRVDFNGTLSAATNYDVTTATSTSRGTSPSLNTARILAISGTCTLTTSGGANSANGFITAGGATFALNGGFRCGTLKELVLFAEAAPINVGAAIANSSSGASAVTIAGTNTVTFSGANTYSAGTFVNSGTLVLSGSGTLGGTNNNALTVSGTLDLGGKSVTVGAVTNYGGTIQNGTLTNSSFLANISVTATVNANLAGASSTVTKNGAGTLILSGANSYGGATTVNAGTLGVSSAQTGTGAITVNGGSTLSVAVSGTSQLQPTALTLGSGAGGATNTLSGLFSTSVAPLKPAALTINGASVINVVSVTPVVGTYPLIVATTTNGSGTLALGSLPTGVTAHLAVTGTGPFSYALVVDSVLSDIWTAGNGAWDTSSPNWTGLSTVYSDGQAVLFDDSASGAGPFTVTITPASVSPAAMVVNNTNKNYSIIGTVAGSAALTKSASGTLTLLGTNTYSGGTIIGAGTLQLGDGVSSNGVVAGNISDNAALIVANANDQALSGVISGSGTLTKSSSGTLALSGANSYSGGTAINAGVLQLTASATAAGSGAITNNAALLVTASGTVANNINNGAVITNNAAATYSGVISGGGTITAVGASDAVLAGANPFTGDVYVNTTTTDAGVVASNNAALGTSSKTVHVNSGSTTTPALKVAAGVTVPSAITAELTTTATYRARLEVSGSGTATWNGPISLPGDATPSSDIVEFRGNGATNTLVINGNIMGTSGRLIAIRNGGTTILNGTVNLTPSTGSAQIQTADGNATLVVNSTGNNWGTNLFANGGTWTIGANNALPVASVLAQQAADLGTLNLNGFNQQIAGMNVNVGVTIRNSSTNADSTLTYSSTGASTYGGVLVDGSTRKLALTVAAGTLTLTNAGDTYSGNTTINGGVIQLGNPGVIPSGAGKGNIAINTGGTLDLNTFSETVNSLSGTGTVDTVAGGAPTLTVGANDASGTFNGVIQNSSGTLALTKTGAGTVTLAGANTYSGNTTVSQAKLVVSSAQVTTTDNASVAIGAALGVSLSGTSQWTPATLTVGSGGTGATLEFNAVVNVGTAPLAPASTTVNGTATVNVNSINGASALNGVYPLMASTPSGATIGSSGTFSLNTTPPGTTGHLTIPSNGGPLNFVVDSISDIWTGTAGNGNWDTTTDNWNVPNYANGDNVLFDDGAAGTTAVTVNAALTPGTISVNNSALAYSIASSSGKAIGGTHALDKTGTGTLTLSGPNTYSGGTSLSAGQLNIGSGSTGSANSPIGTGPLTISGGTLDNVSGSDMTLQPTIAENWNGDFTYAGSANGLNLGAGAVTLGGSRQVTVVTNTLTVSGLIADGGSGYGLTKIGNGTLALANANTYAGTTTLSAGQLNVNNNGAISTNTFTISGGTIDNTSPGDVTLTGNNPQNWNADFTYVGSAHNLNLGAGAVTMSTNRIVTVSGNTLTVGGVISGSSASVGLTKAGAGNLVLIGNNTFTGNLFGRVGTVVIDSGGVVATDGSYCSIGLTTNDNATLTLKGNGVFTTSSDFNAGDLANSIGTLNVQDSAALTAGQFFVGSANAAGSTASGNVNQTGGTVTETNSGVGFFVIGGRTSTNGVGVYNISGGTLNAAAGIRVGSSGAGTLNVSGSSTVNANGGINIARISGGVGTANLNGGVVNTFNITSSTSTNCTNHFNGSTVKPTANSTAWISALASADVRNGGAIIDTAGFNVIVPQPLLHSTISGDNATDGGLTKNGNGSLTLTTNATYTGPTTVNAGVLRDNSLITGNLIVNSGGTLWPGAGGVSDSLTILGNLTLNAGSTNLFDVNGTTLTHESVTLGQNVTYGGTLVIATNGSFSAGETFTLFSGAGAASASNFSGIEGSPGSGLGFTFTNGVLSVVTIGPSGPAYLTNSVSGNTLSISWPPGQGWRLQTSPSIQPTAWVYLTDGSVSSTNIVIDPTRPTVFYRLTYP